MIRYAGLPLALAAIITFAACVWGDTNWFPPMFWMSGFCVGFAASQIAERSVKRRT